MIPAQANTSVVLGQNIYLILDLIVTGRSLVVSVVRTL